MLLRNIYYMMKIMLDRIELFRLQIKVHHCGKHTIDPLCPNQRSIPESHFAACENNWLAIVNIQLSSSV